MQRHILIAMTVGLSIFVGGKTARATSADTAQHPITLVVPFSAGGGTDILARLIADKLRAKTAQTVVVDNRPGANGLVASQFVGNAKPDGLTLMLGSNSTHVIAPLLLPDKTGIDTFKKKFRLVSIIAGTPLVLGVSEKSEVKTIKQFLADGQKERTFGTFGVNSSPHLMGTLLAAESGLRLVHVPYKGSSQAVADLLGGTIDNVFLTVAAVKTYIDAKQIRALAVTGTERIATLSDVPTFQEVGVGGMENAGWFAIFVPGATSEEMVQRLKSDLRDVMAQPDMKAKLEEFGLQSAEPFQNDEESVWDSSIAATRVILRKSGVTLN